MATGYEHGQDLSDRRPRESARYGLPKQGKNFIGSGDLSQSREYPLNAVLVRNGVHVGHRIHDQGYVVAVVMRIARCGFHANAR